MMHDDNRPMVDVDVCRKGEPRRPGTLGRILVTLQKVIQDVDFDGALIAGRVRKSSELIPPSFPIVA
jgi:hypothetical protein